MASSPKVRDQDLIGKCAIITGASRGIGRATAVHLALRGCAILGTCSSAENVHLISSLDSNISNIYKSSEHKAPRIVGIHADIFSPACAQTIVDAIDQHFNGKVNIFVNNAAYANAEIIGEITLQEIEKSNTGNITTPILIVEELVKRKMFQRNSRIIYISSVRSRKPNDLQPLYAASKAGGEALCRIWSQAFGGKNEKYVFMAGTTANAVSVGLTATRAVMSMDQASIDGFKQDFITAQASPEMGQPEDVADVVGMLCGNDARWITGSVVSASGGAFTVV